MQLQNIVRSDRDGIKILMNDIQCIPVSGNLLFVSVSGCRFILYQLFDSGVGGNDSFNGIRCFGTLYLCNLNKLFELIRTLLKIHLLLARFFVYGSNETQYFRIPFHVLDQRIVEGSHNLPLYVFP